jgi:hypothetical protein
MKRSLFCLPLLALALCAGCADTYYASPYAYSSSPAYSRTTVITTRTTTMGAGPMTGTVCQDGTLMPPNSACALHGGIDRQTTYWSAFPHY